MTFDRNFCKNNDIWAYGSESPELPAEIANLSTFVNKTIQNEKSYLLASHIDINATIPQFTRY
jgi:hypothetical protein